MSRNYFTTGRFNKYLSDWLTVICLVLVFFYYTETLQPFYRQFTLNDPKLSFPFARVEQVTDNQLYLYSTTIPSLLIILVISVRSSNSIDKIHLVQISLLGLWLSVSSVSVITDLLKVMIGNPRPDFLERCGGKGPHNQLVDVSVCTAPMGQMYLSDGMKSTPSGHSSMAFAGLVYLTLWTIGQFKVVQFRNTPNKIVYLILVNVPIVFAGYIALSRTQDYRHHFFDIILGSTLGVLFAIGSYYKYFHGIFDQDCNEPIDYK